MDIKRNSGLLEVLRNHADSKPNKIAFTFIKGKNLQASFITFQELYEKAMIAADYLHKNDFSGKTVLLIYPTGVDFIIAFLGCLLARVIAIPAACQDKIEFNRMKEHLRAIALDAQASAILTSSALSPVFEQTYLDHALIKKLLISDELIAQHKLAEQVEFISALSFLPITYLQYSSGSTAQPKGIITTVSQLNCSLAATASAWRFTQDSTMVNWPSHGHVYGLVCGILLPLYVGAHGVILRPLDVIQFPINWLQSISKHHATHSGCPNFGYDLCASQIKDEQCKALDLSSWKVAINGGEPVRLDTLKQFASRFSLYGFLPEAFCPAYGMSELTGLISAKPLIDLHEPSLYRTVQLPQARHIVSCGKPVSGVDVLIVDPQTLVPQDNDQEGEIWLAGDSLTPGYWNREIENENSFCQSHFLNPKKTYLRTGDLGFLREGELYLTGRLKELIIIHGKNYWPLDLELTVKASHTVLDNDKATVVFSLLLHNKEELFVVQELPDTLSEASLQEIAKSIRRLISSKHALDVYSVVFVPFNTLPRTHSGKLKCSLCKNLYENNQLAIILEDKKTAHLPPSASVSLPLLPSMPLLNKNFTTAIVKLAADTLGINVSSISADQFISELGFNSITITQLTNKTNELYALELTPSVFFESKTLQDFSNRILQENIEKVAKYYNLANLKAPAMADENKLNQTSPASSLNSFADIAVIGMQGVFPGSPDLETFWENLISQKDLISVANDERWDWRRYPSDKNQLNYSPAKWGGFISEVDKFAAEFFNISPREAIYMDPRQRLLLEITWQTLEDAGYVPGSISDKSVGVFIGASHSDYHSLLLKNNQYEAHAVAGTANSIIANRISYIFNFTGPSETIDTACSSSLVAVHRAIVALQRGECRLAIAGGANLLLDPDIFVSLAKARMLSQNGRCKTFDQAADGYVRGEGCATVLLKPLHHAIWDKDHIYAVIKGSVINHGGKVSSLTVPNPKAQADLIVQTCLGAGVDVRTVNYIEAHGSGTALGDPIEINGLKMAFNALAQTSEVQQPYCGVGTVKTNIGHLEAAAGIAGLIKILLALKHGTLPGMLHFRTLNPYINLAKSPFYIADKNRDWMPLVSEQGRTIPRRAGISSFGFGGVNAHILVEESPVSYTPGKSDKPYYLMTLSAKSHAALEKKCQSMLFWLEKYGENYTLEDISFTLNNCREHFKCRVPFIVCSVNDFIQQLSTVAVKDYAALYNHSREDVEKCLPEDVLNRLKDLNQKNSDYKTEYYNLLLLIAEHYSSGDPIDWSKLHEQESKQKIPLPVYIFEKKRYWYTTLTTPETQSLRTVE